MSKRAVELFVFDIFIAIIKIEKTVSRFSDAQSLLHSYTEWDSVIREFEIIGEASRHLLGEEILASEYRPVVDFRNVIIHEYFGIDPDEVWGVIEQSIPPFRKVIEDIITEIPFELKSELVHAYIEDNRYLDFVVKALEDIEKQCN